MITSKEHSPYKEEIQEANGFLDQKKKKKSKWVDKAHLFCCRWTLILFSFPTLHDKPKPVRDPETIRKNQ